MSVEYEMPNNPIELAKIRAEQPRSDMFDMTLADERTLAELDYGASQLGFLDTQYFVDTNSAFELPAGFDANRPLNIVKYGEGLSFEGTFVTYSKVHIGRLVGGSAVRALCLAFDDVLMLPYFDRVDKSKLLHVPVLAVESINSSG